MTLTEFLLARIAEDEANADLVDTVPSATVHVPLWLVAWHGLRRVD